MADQADAENGHISEPSFIADNLELNSVEINGRVADSFDFGVVGGGDIIDNG